MFYIQATQNASDGERADAHLFADSEYALKKGCREILNGVLIDSDGLIVFCDTQAAAQWEIDQLDAVFDQPVFSDVQIISTKDGSDWVKAQIEFHPCGEA